MIFKFVLVLLFLKQIESIVNTTINIAIADTKINAITNYTWTLSFTDTASRTWMVFTFPTSVTTTANTFAQIGGVRFNSTIAGSNSINISTSTVSISAIVTVVVANIQNPYSALTSVTAYTFTSSVDTTPVTLALIASKNYASGTLSSCGWSFNKCTEQQNSKLSITLNTVNHIPAGSQTFLIGFPAVWANQPSKSIFYGSPGLTCSVKFNGGSVVSSGVSCSNTTTTITVSYNLGSQLNGNDTIVIYVEGVMSPPTINTPTNTLYTAQTADSSGNTIDGISTGGYCTVLPTCLTNYSNGVFTPNTLPIGTTTTTTISTAFNAFPTITFMQSDSVEISYSEESNLVGCGVFRVLRNAKVYDLISSGGGGVMSFYFPTSAALPNIDYAFPIQVYIECTSITAPSSEATSTFLYKFRRNGDLYMQLSGAFTATALPFNSTNATLTLSNYQMGSSPTTYQFSFTIGHALGSTPQIILSFPADISLSGVTCSAVVGGASASVVSCSNSSSDLKIDLSVGSTISPGTSLVINVMGVTNPLQPLTYSFGLATYYNSSVNTSRVEYSTSAFNATYTTITNLNITLTPSTFTVYAFTPINISFTTPVALPASSTFTLTFPGEVSQLSPSSQPLIVGGSFVLLSSTPITSGSTVNFSNYYAVGIGSAIVITLSIRAPTYVATFASIELRVKQGNLTYITSTNRMPFQVVTPANMPVTVSPLTSITGIISPYTITLTLTIPHPLNFNIRVDAGSDTAFVSVGSTCSSPCTSVTLIGSNSLMLSINNPYANSATPMNIGFNVSSFVNPRSVGSGSLWNFTTRTSSSNDISYESNYPTISVPNLLNGALLASQIYYRNNTNTVKMQLNFTNLLISTDYLLISMDRTTYDVYSTVVCSPIYGICSLDPASTPKVLVVKIAPNASNLFANPLEVWLEGLISGGSTFYFQTDYITVGSYNFNGSLIDQGKIAYNIGCRDALSLPNNCKTCTTTGACLTCYVSQGYFLNGSVCVTNCGTATNYEQFGNNSTGTCQSCASGGFNCLTCTNASTCITCLNSNYYLYTTNMSCSLFCSNTMGFVATVISGIKVCAPCADSNCIVCSNTSFGSCTQCSPTSNLVSGICSSGCPTPSYYVSSGQCVKCDVSCYTCTGPDSQSCTVCATSYYNNSGTCVNTCPNGTAVVPSTGACGCLSTCAKCDSTNYAICTACLNSSMVIYNGQCMSSCPNLTFPSGSNCISCSTGCSNCTNSICTICFANWYLYQGQCYSDCNLVSQQYDASGLVCKLCPDGCDTCSGTTCNTCLSQYVLSSQSCMKACLLTNSCDITGQSVLPLPGTIAVFIWCLVVACIRLISHKNYVPYSLIFFSALVQFILVLAVISTASKSVSYSRLLILDTVSKNMVIGLLIFTLVVNYILNIAYLVVFVRYIKPLVKKPEQIDYISNVATLAIATITNYRFAIVAFSKMVPKPKIHIEMPKYLTPIHYISFANVLLSIVPLAAGGLCVSKQQKLTTFYMLALDLMIIVIFNDLITIWFISSSKGEEYYQNELKKQYTSENNDINITKQNIFAKNQKEESNANMIASVHNSQKISRDSDDYDFGESFKKFKSKKMKIKGINDNAIVIQDGSQKGPRTYRKQKRQQQDPSSSQKITNIFSMSKDQEPAFTESGDVNFEERVTNRNSRFRDDSKKSLQRSFTMDKYINRPRLPDHQDSIFEKQLNLKQKDQIKQSLNDDSDQQSSINFEESLQKLDSRMASTIFHPKDKLPKREEANKSAFTKNQQIRRNQENNISMKKGNNRYAESEATHFQKDEKEERDLSNDDVSEIIKMKVRESNIRQSQNISMLSNQENDLEEISPSYYNAQNQRFHIQDLDTLSQT